jgi:hypothetical protein
MGDPKVQATIWEKSVKWNKSTQKSSKSTKNYHKKVVKVLPEVV